MLNMHGYEMVQNIKFENQAVWQIWGFPLWAPFSTPEKRYANYFYMVDDRKIKVGIVVTNTILFPETLSKSFSSI